MNKGVIAIIAAVILVGGGVGAFALAGAPAAPKEPTPEEVFAQLTTPTIPAANALGSPDAKITIVEFGDYLCTYCHRFHQETKDQLVADYVDTGKVQFMFKDFPINDHLAGGSSLGARASYCAADQGKFWAFHDGMYHNWGGEKAGWITKENMLTYARNAGVEDIDQFKSCLDSNKYADVVRENYRLAQTVGLSGTPSFIIIPEEGQPHLFRGAYPYSAFQSVLDQQLAG
jgi:protein-disulfide isomerase